MTSRKVICAGCKKLSYSYETTFYRKKRWCGDEKCKSVIDEKVKHSNYKKAQRKIEKGTFRNGVHPELREKIKLRDFNKCRMCFEQKDIHRLQVHHIIPVSNGGTDNEENLILLCYECHTNVHNTNWENYVGQFYGYTQKLYTKNSNKNSIKKIGVGNCLTK